MNPLVKLTLLAAALAATLGGRTALGDTPGEGRSLLELTTPAGAVRGRLAARTNSAAYLFAPSGELNTVPLAAVTGYRRLAPHFRPASARAVAGELKKTLGPGGAVFRTRRYVVVRHAGRVGGTFGAELEHIYAAVAGWFARRGVAVREPEFPLVAVVLPDFARFAEVAAADGVARSPDRVPRGLCGYYGPASNRLTVWEPPGGRGPLDRRFRDTLTHEAVHQIAFNGGLHHRTGGTPRWVAEGLATALEPPAFLSPTGGRTPADRANAERLAAFRARAGRRESGYLDDLVCGPRGDDVGADVPAFYAESWALTFYLMNARGGAYARYLRATGEKTAADPDDPAARRADFRAAFGTTPRRLEPAVEAYLAAL